MLVACFALTPREPVGYSQFAVIDIDQISDISSTEREQLGNVILRARFDPVLLADLAEELGWENIRLMIRDQGIARRGPVSRGDFGEALLSHFLEEHHGYQIPVHKLRFKFTAGQTLPSTDILALLVGEDGEISEVCYIESKLRTGADNMAAVDGYRQLLNDYQSVLPDILLFVAARLHDRIDPLFPAFRTYMASRRDTTDNDSFRLGLCWDSAHWSERALENLEDNGVELNALTVHILRLRNLRTLTDEILSSMGAITILDDD